MEIINIDEAKTYSSPKVELIDPHLKFRRPLTPLNLSSVKRIVLHHAQWKNASVEDIHEDHKQRTDASGEFWNGGGYNYYVRTDGRIFIMRGLNVGAHSGGKNSSSIGICAEGNYAENSGQMPEAQRKSISDLCANLILSIPSLKQSVISIKKHSDVCSSECPGAYYPFNDVKTITKNLIAGDSSIRQNFGYIETTAYSAPQYDGDIGIYLPRDIESWYEVSEKTGVSVDTLKEWNNAGSKKVVLPGMEIIYPRSSFASFMENASFYEDLADEEMEDATRIMHVAGFEHSANERRARGASPSVPQNVSFDTSMGSTDSRPGYYDASLEEKDRAQLMVSSPDGKKTSFVFAIDPSSLNESYLAMISKKITNGGILLDDRGMDLPSISFSGTLIETDDLAEKRDLLKYYMKHLSAKQIDGGWVSESICSLYIEGTQYIGLIASMSFSRSASSRAKTQYSISFMAKRTMGLSTVFLAKKSESLISTMNIYATIKDLMA